MFLTKLGSKTNVQIKSSLTKAKEIMNLPSMPSLRKKKSQSEQLDKELEELVQKCKSVSEFMATITGENKHTLNLKLCLDDTTEVAKHLQSIIKKKKVESDVAPSVK